MKKIILVVAAAVAALFVVSCQKQEAPAKEYTFNLNASIAPETKASWRTGWEQADEIFLTFGEDACMATGKYLKFIYNDSSWDLATDSATASALISSLGSGGSGHYCAALASTSGNLTYDKWSGGAYQYFKNNYDEVLVSEAAVYSVDGTTVTVSLNFSHPERCCQITVKGIDKSWKIAGDKLCPYNLARIPVGSNYAGSSDVEHTNQYNAEITPAPCDGDAKCYCYSYYSDGETMVFTLKHDTYGTWKKSFDSKGKAGKRAFIMQGPTDYSGTSSNGWTKQ